MIIKYKIVLLSEWHIGSGLGAGAETDAEMLKDNFGMPYMPGKTIKGLLKDAFMDIADVNDKEITEKDILAVFGNFEESQNKSIPRQAYFTNATLKKDEYQELVENKLQPYLFKHFASTAIDENGIADDKSLRVTEVCMPLTLEGEIEVDDDYKTKIELASKWVRHIGVNRNRGLGRCKIIIEKNEN